MAIIENGTRADQIVSAGRLVDLARLAAAHAQAGGPSLIIIGDVAAYAAAVETPPLAKVS